MARNRNNKKQKAAAKQDKEKDNRKQKGHSADDASPSSQGTRHIKVDSVLNASYPEGKFMENNGVSWTECIDFLELTKAVVPEPSVGPKDPRARLRQIPWRDLIHAAILFCLVFGALYVLVNYLLSQTRALAASCEPSTVFVPVTQNVTTTETVLYSAPSTDLTTVVLTTVAATTTITAGQPVSVASPSSGAPYTFSIVGSSTLWEGGVSPTSGAQLSVATSTVTLSPIDSTSAESTTWITLTSTSTVEKLTTITLPATTSTTYSLLSTMLTTTLTSTHYVTQSISDAPSRSAFSGVSSVGWNASSTQPIQSTPALPAMTTLTETHYYGSDNITTSTSTNRITTTLGAIITTTMLPPTTVVTVNVPGAPLSVTTVTAAPVTVTYTVQSELSAFSTSVSFSSVQSSTETVAAAVTTAGLNSTSPTSPTTSGTQPGLPPSYNSQASLSSLGVASSALVGATDVPLPASSPPPGISTVTTSNETVPASVTATGSSSQSSIPTVFTVTSFLSGSGTTLTLTSSPILTTPMSTYSSGGSASGSASAISSSEPTSPGVPTTNRSVTGSSPTGNESATLPGSSRPALQSSTGSTNSMLGSTSASIVDTSFMPLISSASSLSLSRTMISSPSTLSSGPTRASNSISNPTSSSAAQSRNVTLSVSATTTASSTISYRSSASSATSTPTRGCGEQGNFTMDFDDLPTFQPGRSVKRNHRRQSNDTSFDGSDITRQPPLGLRPYHHLTFSNGFVYGPQLVEPFAPVSQPNVAAFLADGTGVRTGSRPSDTGEIGDSPAQDNVSAFWFDAFNAFLGCDNAGPGNCTMEVTGLRWDPVVEDEVPAFVQSYSLPPCPTNRNCALTPVTFPGTARGLSGLEIRAARNGVPRMFFMDDMHMAWSNTTCDAGMLRQRTQ